MTRTFSPWSPLAHRLLRSIRQNRAPSGRLGVAVSGGADSVALLYLLKELAPALRLELVILHAHHGGEGADRESAAAFCRQLAEREGVPYFEVRAERDLHREAEMRDFRRKGLTAIARDQGLVGVATAHHADDLLETRLMRLIRGTGPAGFKAIRIWTGIWWRPILELSRAELRAYLREKKLNFIEDLSNSDTRYLRNWVRHEWLEKLEQRSPGSSLRMARSMELLVENLEAAEVAVDDGRHRGLFSENGALSRPHYEILSAAQQKRLLSLWLKKLGRAQYSSSQIEEIRRQLDISKNRHTFTVAGLRFVANAKQIEAFLTSP